MATIHSLQSLAPTSRRHRRPKHKFQVRTRPYAITPFLIAPVLPGESLQSYYAEAREVTDPIKSPLIGWHSHFFLFYVKVRDLNERDTLDDLFLAPTASVVALNEAASVPFYHRGGAPNYTGLCLKRVTETYFRDEGEAWNAAMIGDYPAAQFRDQGWMDSLIDTTVMAEGAGNPAVDATTPEALDKMMDAYEYLRAMNMMDMDFEDYLKTFGVRIPKSELHKPELIESWSEFQYPSNTVEPTTGVPTSAVSWVHKSIKRKKTFFREPGFLFGVHLLRPKVYFGRQYGSLTHHLDQGLSWLPAIMKDSPETSLREFTGGAAGNGPLSNGSAPASPTNGYWIDMRDLFLHGDQFVNFALSAGDANLMGVPTQALARKYLTGADVDALFTAPGDGKNLVRMDGFTSFDILGMQVDFTPTTNSMGL